MAGILHIRALISINNETNELGRAFKISRRGAGRQKNSFGATRADFSDSLQEA
jgi:hypothetical protein